MTDPAAPSRPDPEPEPVGDGHEDTVTPGDRIDPAQFPPADEED